MATLDIAMPGRKRDWTALPWPLMGAGLGLCLLALAVTLSVQSEPGVFRLLLLTGGLLCAGCALAGRLSTGGPAFFERVLGPSRGLLLVLLAGLFVLLVLGATAIVVLSFFNLPNFPWGTGTALVLWLVVAPAGILTARRALRLRQPGGVVTAGEEAALFLLLTALCCFVACWALYLPDDPGSWDTMRLALAVFTVVALIAAPLPLATPRVRRWTISVVVFLHFAAVVSATLSAPPTPWLMGQIWTRLSRPYLEFMYLNNAYHFYAPEPGPATYLWFRLIYSDGDGHEVGDWYKLPTVDTQGRHQHTAALEYQRYLSLTESVVNAEATPSFFVITPQGGQVPAAFFRLRQENTPQTAIVLGKRAPKMPIPFHPLVAMTQQYSMPNALSKRLMSSYIRHVATMRQAPPAECEGYKLASIKVYKVRHEIIPAEALKWDPPLSPNDPQLYQPFYMGQFDAQGKLLDGPTFDERGALVNAGDPFLYWLLPVLRENSSNLRSPAHDFARKHAGDPDWIYVPSEDKWMDEVHARTAMLGMEE